MDMNLNIDKADSYSYMLKGIGDNKITFTKK